MPTNVDRWFEDPYVMYTPAVLAPDPALVDEAGLYVELARRMGVTLALPGGDAATRTTGATPDELLELSYPFSRVPWAELRAASGGALRQELTLTVAPADEDAARPLRRSPPTASPPSSTASATSSTRTASCAATTRRCTRPA